MSEKQGSPASQLNAHSGYSILCFFSLFLKETAFLLKVVAGDNSKQMTGMRNSRIFSLVTDGERDSCDRLHAYQLPVCVRVERILS